MDKEIIIDGVDISECSYAITPKRQCPNKPMPYAKETSCIGCKEHNTKLNFCKNNPNCYYKQLKRLKAENFELKESLKVFQRPDITKILTLYKVGDIELLEQKCDKLQVENEKLQTVLDNDEKLLIKYVKTLLDIKDIAEKMYNTNDEDVERDFYIKLQAKINEVIGAEE